MATFFVDRSGTELRADGRALAIYENGALQRTIPLSVLERVVVSARITLTSGLVTAMARQGVGLLLLGRTDLEHSAFLLGRPLGDAARRLAQYRAFLNPEWRAGWSLRLLRAKFAAQARTLRGLIRERPDQRKPLFDALQQLSRLGAILKPGVQSPAACMGLEGAAATAYFQALTAVFPPALGFCGRNRRPPRDPVNAALSLAYTLAHYDAVRTIHAAGLDPFLGFYHGLVWNRESLACDLIEPLRPRLDHWVWGLFRARTLRAEHFRTIRGACLLGKTGRRLFYEAHEPLAVLIRRRLRRLGRLVVRALESAFPVPKEVSNYEDSLS